MPCLYMYSLNCFPLNLRHAFEMIFLMFILVSLKIQYAYIYEIPHGLSSRDFIFYPITNVLQERQQKTKTTNNQKLFLSV